MVDQLVRDELTLHFPAIPWAWNTTTIWSVPPAGWTWWQRPCIIRNGTKTWLCYQTDRQMVAEYDHGTDQITHTDISVTQQKDDHNQATLYVRPSDNRLIAFFCNHSGPNLYRRISTNPMDATSWGAAATIDAFADNGVTYPSPLVLGGNLFLVVRRARTTQPSQEWILIPLTSDGLNTNPSNREHVWSGTTSSDAPYVMARSNGSRIDFFCSESHGGSDIASRNRQLRHFYRDSAGNYCDSLGTNIGNPHNNHSLASLIVDTSPNDTCWQEDVGYDAAGNPHMLYQRVVSEDFTNHHYWYARWTGSNWDNFQITNGGKSPSTVASPNVEYGYSGGASFDPEDPTTVYLSVEVGGILEIQRWSIADPANPVKTADITTGSAKDNLRPRLAIDRVLSDPAQLAWMGDGDYKHFRLFETRMMG